ncbi:ShlB/FhaC/HecB family hemolysin secretion/activation protein [Lysobacter sp. GCM10012299]|uniref:ShlB/FhaC/HecB family hemolysin secretion/activation protein n=1 Tax=Lysobacter sp. GCM10012299 TaxID=3317333 RepID=UPI00360FDEDD
MQEQIERELDDSRRRAQTPLDKAKGISTVLPEKALQGAAFTVSEIRIDAGGFDKKVEVVDVMRGYLGRTLDHQGLFSLVRDVTNRYAEAGYVTTTIGLVPVNLSQGVLELQVRWGLVEGWRIDGRRPETFAERAMVAQAMPGAIGRPLNIRDIDQAIENLNNFHKSARIDVEPATRDGYSILHLRTSSSRLPSLSLNADNSGTRSPTFGRYRLSATANLSDVLLGNDTISVNGSSRRYRDGAAFYEYSGGASYNVPYGRAQADVRFTETRYKQAISGYYGKYSTYGNSQLYSLKPVVVLARNKTRKVSAFAELEHRTSANYVGDTYLAVNSKPYTTLGLGLQWVTQWAGGSLYADAAVVSGVPWFRGEQSAVDSAGAKRYLRKIIFNGAWARSFAIGEESVEYSLRLGGQFSDDGMLSAYKQTLGDEFTVRGYKGGVLWGDRGIFAQNTLSLPLKFNSVSISPFLGVDAGYAQNRFEADSRGRTLVGASVGARINHRNANLSFGWAAPLHTHAPDAKPVVYLSAAINSR